MEENKEEFDIHEQLAALSTAHTAQNKQLTNTFGEENIKCFFFFWLNKYHM